MAASRRGRSDPDRPLSLFAETNCLRRGSETRRLLRDGPDSLSDLELLAILVRRGSGETEAFDLARRMLGSGETLREVSRMSVSDLFHLGMGRATAAAVAAAFELGRRVPDRDWRPREVIRGPEDVVLRLGHKLRRLVQEEFWALLLSSAGQIVKEARITVGTLSSSLVHPRECFHLAVKEPAASIIFVHNHPSGNPEPSQEDVAVTRQLAKAGEILGIPVVDHIIIAGKSFVSLAERGLLAPIR